VFKVGIPKDGALHLNWNGSLQRQGAVVYGEADHTWTRKYWYSPLGLEQYLDLVRRAVETRHRVRGDVELIDYDDDGAYITLRFKIKTTETNLARAYDAVRKVEAEVLEAAEQAADEVGQRIAEIAARLSGWGSERLDGLVDVRLTCSPKMRFADICCICVSAASRLAPSSRITAAFSSCISARSTASGHFSQKKSQSAQAQAAPQRPLGCRSSCPSWMRQNPRSPDGTSAHVRVRTADQRGRGAGSHRHRQSQSAGSDHRQRQQGAPSPNPNAG
jgi:hypothetical protein